MFLSFNTIFVCHYASAHRLGTSTHTTTLSKQVKEGKSWGVMEEQKILPMVTSPLISASTQTTAPGDILTLLEQDQKKNENKTY